MKIFQFLFILRKKYRIRLAARAIWDDFGGECGNDADYCRWTGKPGDVGKCYCQMTAWRHAAIAHGEKP